MKHSLPTHETGTREQWLAKCLELLKAENARARFVSLSDANEDGSRLGTASNSSLPSAPRGFFADAGWRQIHHHGSIEDAEMLSRYQGIVLECST